MLSIEFRPLLVSGMFADTKAGETILIDSEQGPEAQNEALWHETIHLLLRAAGVHDHDEKRIEKMALALSRACPGFARTLRECLPQSQRSQEPK